VFISKYHPAYLTDCIWSARPGLFFVSRNDGWINAYDLCYKMNEPTFSYKVCDSPLTSICLNSKGDKLIVGDEDGKIYIIKLSKSFYVQNDVDIKKEFLNNLFEREVTREKNIEAGAKKKVPAKDETAKLLKQEQTIKERIKKIDQDYADFITKIFDKASTSKKVPPE
jgi:dynein intermediate chain 2